VPISKNMTDTDIGGHPFRNSARREPEPIGKQILVRMARRLESA